MEQEKTIIRRNSELKKSRNTKESKNIYLKLNDKIKNINISSSLKELKPLTFMKTPKFARTLSSDIFPLMTINKAINLPKYTNKTNKKLLIVDLDETLIHSSFKQGVIENADLTFCVRLLNQCKIR